MIPLFINDVVELNGGQFRLLKLVAARLLPEPEGGAPAPSPGAGAYVIALKRPNPLPVFWELSVLQKAVVVSSDGEDKQHQFGRPLEDRPADVAARDLRWSRIRDLVDDSRIWEQQSRGPLLRRHAANIGTTKETLLSDLRMWWSGGQVIDALLSNFYRCGHVEENSKGAEVFRERSESGDEVVVFAPPTQKARGRPRIGGGRPFAFPPRLRKAVLSRAKRYYLEGYHKSITGTARKVLAELFCMRDKNGKPLYKNGQILLRDVGDRPSRDQISYLLKKCIPLSEAYAKRHGKAEYRNNHQPHPGTVDQDTLGAGDVFEIDSTLVDLWIVARGNRKVIINKATLYLVVDRKTRLIVGFYLSLENPSWSEASQAILSIGGDWEKLCRRFGVHYDPADWPARGRIAARFFADRADMMVGDSEGLTDGVRIQVTNAPPLMSSYKPIVEIRFKLVHMPLRRHAPGYEPPENFAKRRGKHYEKDACLTLDELGAILLAAIRTHNTSPLRNYNGTPSEILSDMALTPVNLWNMQTQNFMGIGPRMPTEVLRRKLLVRGSGLVKNDGIHFGYCIYYSEQIREWLATASIAGTFTVTVAYTSNLVDTIVVEDPQDARKTYVVGLGPRSEAYAGWSFREVDAVHRRSRARTRDAEKSHEAAEASLADFVERVSSPALKEARELTKGMPVATRFTQGVEAYTAEARRRRKDVHDLNKPYDPFGSSFPDDDDDDGATESVRPEAPVGPPPSAAAAEVPSGDDGDFENVVERDPSPASREIAVSAESLSELRRFLETTDAA